MAGKENYVTTVHLIQAVSTAVATRPGNVTVTKNGVASFVTKVCLRILSQCKFRAHLKMLSLFGTMTTVGFLECEFVLTTAYF